MVYRCKQFSPKRFFEGMSLGSTLRGAWLNEQAGVLFFITKKELRVGWSRSRALRDKTWDLYVVYHNPTLGLLFIHSTDRDSLYQELAKAVGTDKVELLAGDQVFRCLGGISRLVFQNIGLKRHGRRNLRYSMYTGTDVSNALSPAHKTNSTKSNVFGGGFADGHPVTMGCSYKGRVWSRDQGTIQRFLHWCDAVGRKLLDASIDTEQIIDNVLIPQEIDQLPDTEVLCIDWPRQLLEWAEHQVTLTCQAGEFPFSQFGIEHESTDVANNRIVFAVRHPSFAARYVLRLGGPAGYQVEHLSGEKLTIRCSRIERSLADWLSDSPPSILYVDGSELDGCAHVVPRDRDLQTFPSQRLEAWDWTGVNIEKESMWKDGLLRKDSVQYHAYEQERHAGFDVIFDDDDSGEIADLLCLKEETDHIRLRLLHCKFTTKSDPGKRVKDVVEVCSQAVRSSRWIWRFPELCKRLLSRDTKLGKKGSGTRFLHGDGPKLQYLVKASRFKPVSAEIVVVQPGLSKASITDDQAMVLSAAHGYLLETVNIPLDVVCSE